VCGQEELDDLLSEREDQFTVKRLRRPPTLGIKVSLVEIKHIDLRDAACTGKAQRLNVNAEQSHNEGEFQAHSGLPMPQHY
jgi:hypothetical protein